MLVKGGPAVKQQKLCSGETHLIHVKQSLLVLRATLMTENIFGVYTRPALEYLIYITCKRVCNSPFCNPNTRLCNEQLVPLVQYTMGLIFSISGYKWLANYCIKKWLGMLIAYKQMQYKECSTDKEIYIHVYVYIISYIATTYLTIINCCLFQCVVCCPCVIFINMIFPFFIPFI